MKQNLTKKKLSKVMSRLMKSFDEEPGEAIQEETESTSSEVLEEGEGLEGTSLLSGSPLLKKLSLDLRKRRQALESELSSSLSLSKEEKREGERKTKGVTSKGKKDRSVSPSDQERKRGEKDQEGDKGEESEEDSLIEKVKENLKGKGKCRNKQERGELGEQPRPQEPPVYDVDEEQMNQIINDMPEDRKDLQKGIVRYLDKLQYIALSRAEKTLLNPTSRASSSELIKLATALKDMQLTIRWTKKLEQAILQNPSKLLPQGSGRSFTLLSRVKEMSSATKRENDVDPRKSGIKKGNALLIAREMELPSDDQSVEKKA
jgi:hypothetical protein